MRKPDKILNWEQTLYFGRRSFTMGKIPETAESKFKSANVFFGRAINKRYTIALPTHIDLKEIKKEILLLEEQTTDIARGLADFKEAVLLSLREVKKELNDIEERLPGKPKPLRKR